jgi:hypothetical protein
MNQSQNVGALAERGEIDSSYASSQKLNAPTDHPSLFSGLCLLFCDSTCCVKRKNENLVKRKLAELT